jgi:hypothetical protein
MTYSRFEELPVWQEAIRLADEVYNMMEHKDWSGSRSLPGKGVKYETS